MTLFVFLLCERFAAFGLAALVVAVRYLLGPRP
jgi:hypothetical protein